MTNRALFSVYWHSRLPYRDFIRGESSNQAWAKEKSKPLKRPIYDFSILDQIGSKAGVRFTPRVRKK